MHFSVVSSVLLTLVTLLPTNVVAMQPFAIALVRDPPNADGSAPIALPEARSVMIEAGGPVPSRRQLRQATRDQVVSRSKRPASAKRAETSAEVPPDPVNVRDDGSQHQNGLPANGCFYYNYVANKFSFILSTTSSSNQNAGNITPLFLTFDPSVDQNTAITTCAQQGVDRDLGYYTFNVYYSNTAGAYICQLQYNGATASPHSDDLNLQDNTVSSSLLYTVTATTCPP